MPFSSFYTASTDFEYPQDEVMPDNEFREKALEMIRIMSLALYHVINSRTPNVTAFGVAYALGLTSVLGNERMAQRARKLGVNKSAISRAAMKFLDESGLPPSILMQKTHKHTKPHQQRALKPCLKSARAVMALYDDVPRSQQLELNL